jgi:hypothetical protein
MTEARPLLRTSPGVDRGQVARSDQSRHGNSAVLRVDRHAADGSGLWGDDGSRQGAQQLTTTATLRVRDPTKHLVEVLSATRVSQLVAPLTLDSLAHGLPPSSVADSGALTIAARRRRGRALHVRCQTRAKPLAAPNDTRRAAISDEIWRQSSPFRSGAPGLVVAHLLKPSRVTVLPCRLRGRRADSLDLTGRGANSECAATDARAWLDPCFSAEHDLAHRRFRALRQPCRQPNTDVLSHLPASLSTRPREHTADTRRSC